MYAVDTLTDSLGTQTDISNRRLDIYYLLSPLPPRYRDILLRCHGIGCEKQTLAEIAEVYEIGSARVQQISSKAVRQMRFIAKHGVRRFLATQTSQAHRDHFAEINRSRA